MATVSKTRLIFGIFLMVLIVIIDLALHHLHLATWPAFMVMIFFFESHMNPNRAPHILIGGLFGILNLVLIGIFLKVAAPVLGILPAKLVYVCLFVYLIVALGETVPVLFNNYAFMFFSWPRWPPKFKIRPPIPGCGWASNWWAGSGSSAASWASLD